MSHSQERIMSWAFRGGFRQAVKKLHLSPFIFGTSDGHLKQTTVQLHGNWGVIIPRYRVCYQTGVTVRVHHTYCGNIHFCCISDSHVLLKHIIESRQEDEEVWKANIGAVLDRSIRKETTLPVSCMGVFPTFHGSALHQVTELTPAADKQYNATTIGNVGSEIKSQLKVLYGLVQVNYVLV